MYKKIFLKNFLRIISQGFFIFLFLYFFKKTTFPVSKKLPSNLFFRVDLLIAIFTTISTFHFSHLFFPSVAVFFLLIFFGNFFCFWFCPFGGIIDYTNIILLRKKWKFGIKTLSRLRIIKIFIFWLIILTAFINTFIKVPFLFWIFNPYVILMRGFLNKKIFIIFIILVLISVLIPRFWCNNMCALGYLNYLIGVKLRNKIKKKWKKNEKKRISKTYRRGIFNIFNKR